CVPYCTSKQGKTKLVTFHEFPCEETLREKWIKNISRKDYSGDLWRPADRSVVCSRHFEKRSYKEGCKIRVLKKDSVPTVFEDYSNCVELNSQRQIKKLKLSNERVNSENNTNKCHT
ncbi:THAP domain-containing protein 6, partial [Stegodyphus mimosarum]